MPVFVLTYRVADDGVTEVTEAVKAAFDAIRAKRPDGIRYTYLREAGGTGFAALLQIDEGTPNPLPGIAEARALRDTVARHAVDGDPAPRTYEILGDYLLLGDG